MAKKGKRKSVTLNPKAKPSARDKELLAELAAMEKPGPKDPDTGRPRQPLRDAIELELCYAPSRRVLVAYYTRTYGVSPRTVDRAIEFAKISYAEAMKQPKKEMLEEGKAFMRVAQNRALKLGKIGDATTAKRYELELAGATSPGALDPEGSHAPITADETRAILLARLAAKSQPKGT